MAGGEYIVTQMFFDNRKYFDFVNHCREAGITIPIIPGIKPITTKKQATGLPKVFHIDLPDELLDEIDNCPTDKEVRQVGIEWCINQSKELVKFGVPCLHIYTMGNAETTCRVAKEIF
jgi:methylenetetrahydrofolate reductase (NADPH)